MKSVAPGISFNQIIDPYWYAKESQNHTKLKILEPGLHSHIQSKIIFVQLTMS